MSIMMRRLVGLVLLGWLAATPSYAQQPRNIAEASIRELQLALEKKELTSVQLVDAYLARIEAYDDNGPQLNALIRINPNAREQAQALDEERRITGARGPLHGIPVIIKDNYSTVDMPTTGGSLALADFVPDANATQVQRLLDAGAIILAKANLHEFAYGITTVSSLGGQTRNPYDPTRIPGGSSGGTAAAIAAGFASVGMGSDTCGSIRIPAAFNNLVGLRPSKGLSSIYGIMPLAGTQDVAGPLARSVEDLAIVLDVVSSYDPLDAATAVVQGAVKGKAAHGFRTGLGKRSLQGLRIGRLTSYFEAADEPVRKLLDEALQEMTAQGAIVVEVNIPELSALIASSGVIGQEFEVDLNAYLAEFGATELTTLEQIVATGLYDEAVAMLLTRSAAAEQDPIVYQAQLAARIKLRDAIDLAMQAQQVDVIAYPPIGALPVLIGENQPGNNCSLSSNSGLPALSLPVGFTGTGLPMGIELLGAQFTDVNLLALGYAFEQRTHNRQAPTSVPPLDEN